MSRFVDAGGVRLHYERRGKGRGNANGVPVLLVHGLGDTLASWRPVAKLLAAKGFDVISIDVKGCGKSEKPGAGDWSLPALVRDVIAFADALKIRRFAIAGVSYGGTIALLAAARYPDRVAAVIPCNAFAYRKPASVPFELKLARAVPVLGRISHWFMSRSALEATFRAWNFTPGWKGVSARVDEHWAALASPGGRKAFMRLLQAIDGRDLEIAERAYASIRVPTLIVWGAADRWFPVLQAERLHRAIRGSKLAIVRDGWHLFIEETPAAFVKHAAPFLRKAMAARKARKKGRKRSVAAATPRVDPTVRSSRQATGT